MRVFLGITHSARSIFWLYLICDWLYLIITQVVHAITLPRLESTVDNYLMPLLIFVSIILKSTFREFCQISNCLKIFLSNLVRFNWVYKTFPTKQLLLIFDINYNWEMIAIIVSSKVFQVQQFEIPVETIIKSGTFWNNSLAETRVPSCVNHHLKIWLAVFG